LIGSNKHKHTEESFDRTFSKVRGFLRQSLKPTSADIFAYGKVDSPLRFKRAAPPPTAWNNQNLPLREVLIIHPSQIQYQPIFNILFLDFSHLLRYNCGELKKGKLK
jgi:hypothetical protein